VHGPSLSLKPCLNDVHGRRERSYRLDNEHGVDAALDELLVDLGLDREDAQPIALTERDDFPGLSVRNRAHEHRRIVRRAVLEFDQEPEHRARSSHVRACATPAAASLDVRVVDEGEVVLVALTSQARGCRPRSGSRPCSCSSGVKRPENCHSVAGSLYSRSLCSS
jgi:hypothetical protein